MTEDDKTIIKSIANEAINSRELVSENTCNLKHAEVTDVKKRINWVLVVLIMFVITPAMNFILQYNRATLQAKQISNSEVTALTDAVKTLVKEIQ